MMEEGRSEGAGEMEEERLERKNVGGLNRRNRKVDGDERRGGGGDGRVMIGRRISGRLRSKGVKTRKR